ncbi:winged helix-turn-helix domain-containing protein [Xanthobacter sp. V7C-4]|uniref:winged helix-turn-helix domain-containing protein n=1 Tax=Xanthobacter autotrophicus (strain ATCC BAA-1158 / Py2) TaxID=78245 RepID=UPI00372C6001
MDAYLHIAETVLRLERRPLSSRAIMASAHRLGLVPAHLYGRTQHKTLGARISEDILARRDDSVFFRSAPGRFFLREFLSDVSIPEEFRQPVTTRRRIRDLIRGPSLAFHEHDIISAATNRGFISTRAIMTLLSKDRYQYLAPKDVGKYVFLWSFVCVRRDRELLAYRVGRYRDDRDAFMSKRSIGFWTLVNQSQHTLFNMDDYGIVESGVNAVKIDLDIPSIHSSKADAVSNAALSGFVLTTDSDNKRSLLAIINFSCPEWFEPTKRRLALHDMMWIDPHIPLNNVDDFDPWSQSVLEYTRCKREWIEPLEAP